MVESFHDRKKSAEFEIRVEDNRGYPKEWKLQVDNQ